MDHRQETVLLPTYVKGVEHMPFVTVRRKKDNIQAEKKIADAIAKNSCRDL